MYVFGIDIPLDVVLLVLLIIAAVELLLIIKAFKKIKQREMLQAAINKAVGNHDVEESDEEPDEALPEIADEEESGNVGPDDEEPLARV